MRQRTAARILTTLVLLTLVLSGLYIVGTSSVSGAATPPAGFGEGSTWCQQAVPGGVNLRYSYKDVYACGPANNSDTGYEVPASSGAYPTYAGFFEGSDYEFQCTELADRFLFDIWNKNPVSDNAFNGYNLVGANFAATVAHAYPSVPLVNNGTVNEPYLPGDIVSFADGGDGHVAVVTKSTENASGNGKITLMEENASKSGKTTATVTDWVMGKPADSSIESPSNFDALAVGPPAVSSFQASPSSLPASGGSVTLTANVTNGITCTLSSNKTIPGLPTTIACSNGTYESEFTVPANTKKRTVTYKFKLSVAGTKALEAKTTATVGTFVPSIGSTWSLGYQNGDCVFLEHFNGPGTFAIPDGILTGGTYVVTGTSLEETFSGVSPGFTANFDWSNSQNEYVGEVFSQGQPFLDVTLHQGATSDC